MTTQLSGSALIQKLRDGSLNAGSNYMVVTVASSDMKPNEGREEVSQEPEIFSAPEPGEVNENPVIVCLRHNRGTWKEHEEEQHPLTIDVCQPKWVDGRPVFVSQWMGLAAAYPRKDKVKTRWERIRANSKICCRVGFPGDREREISLKEEIISGTKCVGIYVGGILDYAIPLSVMAQGRVRFNVVEGQKVNHGDPLVIADRSARVVKSMLYPFSGPEPNQRNFMRHVRPPFLWSGGRLGKTMTELVHRYLRAKVENRRDCGSAHWIDDVCVGFDSLKELSLVTRIPANFWSGLAKTRFVRMMSQDTITLKAHTPGWPVQTRISDYCEHMRDIIGDYDQRLGMCIGGGLFENAVKERVAEGAPVRVDQGEVIEEISTEGLPGKGCANFESALAQFEADKGLLEDLVSVFWWTNVVVKNGVYWLDGNLLTPEATAWVLEHASAEPRIGMRSMDAPITTSSDRGMMSSILRIGAEMSRAGGGVGVGDGLASIVLK